MPLLNRLPLSPRPLVSLQDAPPLLLPPSPTSGGDQARLFAEAVSRLLGWTYFLMWSASFWPQALIHHRRKTVAGMSLDLLALNVLGFFCYSAFNLAFLLSPTVQDEYRGSHGGKSNVVRWNDALFALHALGMSVWQAGQAVVYAKAPGQRVSNWAKLLLAASASALVAASAAVAAGRWRAIELVNLCAQIKLGITLVKYAILLNARRRSTRGFAILNILLDVGGSVLSFLQLAIDSAVINHDWSGVTGDVGKLGLSLISLFFDSILLAQHYVLYGERDVEEEGWLNHAGSGGGGATRAHARDDGGDEGGPDEAARAYFGRGGDGLAGGGGGRGGGEVGVLGRGADAAPLLGRAARGEDVTHGYGAVVAEGNEGRGGDGEARKGAHGKAP